MDLDQRGDEGRPDRTGQADDLAGATRRSNPGGEGGRHRGLPNSIDRLTALYVGPLTHNMWMGLDSNRINTFADGTATAGTLTNTHTAGASTYTITTADTIATTDARISPPEPCTCGDRSNRFWEHADDGCTWIG